MAKEPWEVEDDHHLVAATDEEAFNSSYMASGVVCVECDRMDGNHKPGCRNNN